MSINIETEWQTLELVNGWRAVSIDKKLDPVEANPTTIDGTKDRPIGSNSDHAAA